MVRRWICYLLLVLGSIGFYLAYRQWFAWFWLVGVLCLPVGVLLMSLPAMLRLRVGMDVPTRVTAGQEVRLEAQTKSRLPMPPCSLRFRVTRLTTGESRSIKENDLLPTEHCAQLRCSFEKAWVYDYLGLFRLRPSQMQTATVTVLPRPVPMEQLPQLERYLSTVWKPKSGGGFSENHELRQYRPGDSLNQVHWKLTAKTGQIIVREAMEPDQRRVVLELELNGTEQELDRKLGRLLWLSTRLLERRVSHELRALTGNGSWSCPVAEPQQLEAALTQLLGQPVCAAGETLEPVAASFCCRIGGEADEA